MRLWPPSTPQTANCQPQRGCTDRRRPSADPHQPLFPSPPAPTCLQVGAKALAGPAALQHCTPLAHLHQHPSILFASAPTCASRSAPKRWLALWRWNTASMAEPPPSPTRSATSSAKSSSTPLPLQDERGGGQLGGGCRSEGRQVGHRLLRRQAASARTDAWAASRPASQPGLHLRP